MKNKISNHIAEWIFIMLCAALGIAAFAVVPNIGSLILILAAVFALPLTFIFKLWGITDNTALVNVSKGLITSRGIRYAVHSFQWEYMAQYSWAEETLASILDRK